VKLFTTNYKIVVAFRFNKCIETTLNLIKLLIYNSCTNTIKGDKFDEEKKYKVCY